MPPRPLQLYRRRWTLVFSLPLVLMMGIVGIYSVYLMFTGDRLVMMFAGCGAFVAFCVGGTFGKSVLEALRNKEPAVIIDARGLSDFRGSVGLIPWHEIASARLGDDEQVILINFGNQADQSRRRLTSTARRLFSGADCTVALGGLSYNFRELEKSLAEHLRHGKTSVGR